MACHHEIGDPYNYILRGCPSKVSVQLRDFILIVGNDTAKLNLIRLFFPESADIANNPQIREGVTNAACWVLSESAPGAMQRHHLAGALNCLWRKACNVQGISTQLPKDPVRSTLDRLRLEFDEIADLKDLLTLKPEELFQLLRKAFFLENNMTEGAPPRHSITREEARSWLAKASGKECVVFSPSESLAGWLNKFLALSYERGLEGCA
jgi:hypothetical protein